MFRLQTLPRTGRKASLALRNGGSAPVCAPSLRQRPEGVWQRAVFWLLGGATRNAAPPLNRLPLVRQEFIRSLGDLPCEATALLFDRVGNARSLRELWHLRPEVYIAVARHHSQHEAETRLAALNRFFPTRAPRSGFVPVLP